MTIKKKYVIIYSQKEKNNFNLKEKKTMEKITKREMYEALAEAANGGEFKFTAEDVITFAEKEIEALDKKAAKAKERAATKAAEGDALAALVENALTDEYQTIAEIAAVVAQEDAEATVSKVTYRLSKLIEAGVAEKTQVTVPAKDGGKSRKIQAYKKA